jgi:hypothetical protein
MRLSSNALAIGALCIAACSHPITAVSSLVQGDWRTAPIPSGSGIDLALVSNGQSVSGTGHQYAIQNLRYTFSITGTLDRDGTVRLTLTSDSASVFTFVGHMVGSDALEGDWGPAVCAPPVCQREPVTFTRQPE